ncbi:uncharacterized protein [Aegilops tauschii subsp. strangulata]|uniref:uncharacterized protein n=1 Tax=Aegilops tauschii subsp. strangulata TaxID=200361 RepID=UPI003CC89497
MLEYVQCWPDEFSNSEEEMVSEANAMTLSTTAIGDPTVPVVSTMKLRVQLQGRTLYFLVDSGSSHTFLDVVVAASMSGVSEMPVSMVRVADDASPQLCAVMEMSALLVTEEVVLSELPQEVQELIEKFAPVFAAPSGLPPRRKYDHTIPLIPGPGPVAIRPYRVAPALKDELERQVQEMLASVIDELLDELAGSSWFSKLDLRSGYHQIRLDPGEEYKTAFQTHNGQFEFLVMPQGLTGGPNTFQLAMNSDLSPALRKCAVVFFDDILVLSATYALHLQHLAEVLQLLLKHQWQVRLSKCAFAQQEIGYLGHIISGQGVSTDPAKISAIQDWPVPVSVKEVRGFLGLAGCYRKFVKLYGVISRPLTSLLKKGVYFHWTDVEKQSFFALKEALASAPVLAVPDFSKKFIVETDACDVGIGAVLMQDGHPLAYPLWLEDIIQSYVDDPFSAPLLQRLALNPQFDKKFSLRVGFPVTYKHVRKLFRWAATGQTPFEVVYGHAPRHFDISVDDTIQSEDLKHWFDQRKVVLHSVQQHLSRAQQRMKVQADKHRTERSFEVGEFVFLKLQPYLQSSVAPRANHELAFKFYGPFQIIARVGEVAYELALPVSSKVHPVFHVSLLKKVLAPGCTALSQLPSSDAHL